MEAVKVPNREYADDPLVFGEVPVWLQDAVNKRRIRPDFRSEDYWYFVVDTPSGQIAAAPDDFILTDQFGNLYVATQRFK